LTRLGLVYLERGEYATAQSYSERAIALRSALGDRRGAAHSLNNLALALSGQGRYDEALTQLHKALDLNQQDGDFNSATINYNNIGLVHFYSGQYLEALRDYHKALEIIEGHSAAEWTAAPRWTALNSLGAVYKKLGWQEKALSIYLNLLKAPAPDPKSLVYARNNIGTAYRSLGDPIKAKDYYEQALAQAVHIENKPAQALLLKNLGLIYALHLRDNTTAAKCLSASLAHSTALHDRYEEANTYNYLAEVARRQGRYTAAQAAYEHALAIAATLALREAQWTARYGLGQLREVQGDLPGAQRYYEESIAVIEVVRAGLRGESLRAGFLADKIEVYEAALRTLLAEQSADAGDGRIAKAFEYAERSKARVMLDRLSEAVAHIEEGVPTDLRRRRQQLLQALAQRPAGSKEEIPTDAESERRQAIERELEAIDLRILESNPRYALVQEPKIVTLIEAQRLLQDRAEALVVFFTGKQSIFAWFITGTQARFLRIPNPAALEASVQTYVRQLTNPASTTYLSLSAELYDTLLQPLLATAPSTINKLIIIPDGFLNSLPFETLQARRADGDGRMRGFLIERTVLMSCFASLALARGDCASFSVTIGSATFTPGPRGDSRTTLSAEQASGQIAQVRGTFVAFDVDLDTFTVTDYTRTGVPAPAQITDQPTTIFTGKVPEARLTGSLNLRVRTSGQHLVMERSGPGIRMKIQAKDCDQGGGLPNGTRTGNDRNEYAGAGVRLLFSGVPQRAEIFHQRNRARLR
jgi:tetratricopeptide (TPR) repeat protein